MNALITFSASQLPAAVRPAPSGSLRIEHVSKSFPLKAGPLLVLDDISLTVEPGEFVAIVGGSGC